MFHIKTLEGTPCNKSGQKHRRQNGQKSPKVERRYATIEKYRILAIAPYEGMRGVLEETAHGMEDVEITIFVADLASGAQLVEQHQNEGYDAIVSRGGTAELINAVATIPVVEIPVSAFDMLRVVQLTRGFDGRMAVVGFSGVTGCARVLSDLLQYAVEVFTIHDSAELPGKLVQLRQEGYNLIIGDTVTTTLAQREGMNAIILTSGSESVRAALNQAVQICRFSAAERQRAAVLSAILEGAGLQVEAFAPDGSTVYNNLPPCDRSGLDMLMRKAIPEVIAKGSLCMVEKTGQRTREIRGKRIRCGNDCAAFYVGKQKATEFVEDEGIRISNHTDQPQKYFDAFYDKSRAMADLVQLARKYSQASHPVLILGEEGTGKSSMAISIHANGRHAGASMVTVDCAFMTPRRWNSLIESPNSPLTAEGLTLYFKSVQRLGVEQKMQLVEYIAATSLQKRHRLLFGYTSDSRQQEDPLYRYITLELGSLLLHIPPLRQRRDGIPFMAMLRISHLSAQYAKQIAGLTPQALEKLQKYDWPNNIDQFNRVLHELVLLAEEAFIKERDVDTVLKKEIGFGRLGGGAEIDLERTLDEIVKDVIFRVLERENMNQTQAASKLGIGRSTLWRKLSQ